MCSLTTPSGRRWDGTPSTPWRLRSLRVAADSPSRLLRTAQPQRCRDCGHRIDWYTRAHGQPVGLHPQELDPAAVPVSCRWHVDSGIAHAAGDGTRWCRIPHPGFPAIVGNSCAAWLSAPLMAIYALRMQHAGVRLTSRLRTPAPVG
ncbi:DUF6083 domain-containing protein [Streptomyces sp. ISL-1]|uniref:DUF6083 domain-containing protein n=1 Tax=Streptomyces sp. ISL-1 TaxID=2817657 RepID=UPI0020362E30|nr:DUF6083 domain-containing protein [Streptomyces sp. ISL-1]